MGQLISSPISSTRKVGGSGVDEGAKDMRAIVQNPIALVGPVLRWV